MGGGGKLNPSDAQNNPPDDGDLIGLDLIGAIMRVGRDNPNGFLVFHQRIFLLPQIRSP